MQLNLHAIIPVSLANGPGRRFTIWFQGCSQNCPGCFNPDTHSFEKRLTIESSEVIEHIAAQPDLDGITISGGEPFEQAMQLLSFLQLFRNEQHTQKLSHRLSVLVFSGLPIARIKVIPDGNKILSLIDVLIDEPYNAKLPAPARAFVSSGNQTIHFLSDRYSPVDFCNLPEAEVIIDADGNVIFSGTHPS